jgi:glucokinase
VARSARHFPSFKEGFEQELKSFGFPNSLKNVEISISSTKQVAVLGAAALCANHVNVNNTEK